MRKMLLQSLRVNHRRQSLKKEEENTGVLAKGSVVQKRTPIKYLKRTRKRRKKRKMSIKMRQIVHPMILGHTAKKTHKIEP